MTTREPISPELEAVLEAALQGDAHPDLRSRTALQALEVIDALPRPEPSARLRRDTLRRLDKIDDAEEKRFTRRLLRILTGPVGGGLALAGAAAAFALVLRTPTVPSEAPEAMARIERLETAEELELYENLDLLENLDVLHELDLIEDLDGEAG